MRKLPAVPVVQKGRASTFDFDKSMHVGDVCVIALVREANGVGTWRLDRIAQLRREPGMRGKEIVAVESGLPVTLNRPEAWDGKRHWYTYALDTAPGDIRARDMWEWWTEQGRPSYRSQRTLQAIIRGFFAVEQAA